MADKLRQMLIALVITVFLVLTTATVQAAVTYWDEHNVAHLHHSSGLTSHNCSYCYGGKAKFAAQSGDYNNGPHFGWYPGNTTRSTPSYFAYIPNFSGDSGAVRMTLASSANQMFVNVNQNSNKGMFVYIGGFSTTISWDDLYYNNRCVQGFTCTNWRILWWDQIRINTP